MGPLRLGVNIDHVATLRNARGAPYPDPLRAAQIARAAGADIITAHLREDRRHVRDSDIEALTRAHVPLNFEMAATGEMVAMALRVRPHAVCIVPERREELTTEGGLDVAGGRDRLAAFVRDIEAAGIRVSLFIAPDAAQIEAAKSLCVADVELHTGHYAEAVLSGDAAAVDRETAALRRGAATAARLGLEVHAGHGLTYDNVAAIAAIPEIVELQIGHFLVGEAVFVGLDAAVRRMRRLMDEARQ